MVQIAENRDDGLWWDIARKCEYATFFHTPLWHELACATYPLFRDRTVFGVTENEVNIVLPLLETAQHAGGKYRTLTSSFAGCYGGLISDGIVSPDEERQIYRHVLSRHVGRLQLNENPLSRRPAGPPDEKTDQRGDFTHILKLDRDFPSLVSGFQKGHRSSMKKGIKAGVTVRQAHTESDYRAYFDAYRDSLRRWGDRVTNEYPWDLFRQGYLLSRKHPENIVLWLAVLDERILGGAWFFYWNQHAAYWHGAAYEDAFKFCPNNVLQGYIIQDAIDKGYTYYDFFPSGNQEGVARFKSHFGAEKWPFSRWTYRNRLFKISHSVKSKLR